MSSSDTTLLRGEATRQAILTAAERLFVAHGYNGTSLRQIAAAAGSIAVGGIYNHFASKQDIFRALLMARSPYPHVVALLDSIQEGNGPHMLERAFAGMSSLIEEHFGFVRLVAIDIQEHDGSTLVTLIADVLPAAVAFFTRLQAAGDIRQDLNPVELARAFMSLLIGFKLTGFVLFPGDNPRLPIPSHNTRTEWQSAMVDILLHGVSDGSRTPPTRHHG